MSNDPHDAALSHGSMTLTDRARIRGASRMIPDGTDAAAVTADQIRQVAADVESLARKYPDLTRKAIAKATSYSEGVVSDFINGKYKGDAGQVAIDFDAWVDEEDRRRSRPATTQFVWTNVARLIKDTADFAIDYRKISLVYSGDSAGMGKTTAAEAIHADLGPRRSALATMTARSNATVLTKTICEAMGDDNKGSNSERVARIIRKLKGRSHLLIIDQIHNLCGGKNDDAFYYLCDIYDGSKTAQLWLGTQDLLSYFNRQRARQADQSLAQVASRISPCVDLVAECDATGDGGEPLFTVQQIREAFARNKLKLTPTAARWLCTLACLPDAGGLRKCVQLVEYVTAVAEARRWTSIDVPQLKAAMRYSLPSDKAVEALLRVEQQAQHVAGPRAAVG